MGKKAHYNRRDLARFTSLLIFSILGEKEGRLAQVHEKLHGPTKAQKCAKKSPFI